MSDDWHHGDSLTPAEQALLDAVKGGRAHGDLGITPPSLDEMRTWDASRSIRASFLRHLLVEGEWPIPAQGVRLLGHKVIGKLDLAFATLRAPILLTECLIEDDFCIAHARTSRLMLRSCHLAGVLGDGLTATNGIVFAECTVYGDVSLKGATIGGIVAFRGTSILGHDKLGNSLSLDSATLTGTLFLDEGFACRGAIRVINASTWAIALRNNSEIEGYDVEGYSFVGDNVEVRGDIHLCAVIAGAIRLAGATVTGQVALRGASVKGKDSDGDSVYAEGVDVGRQLYLDGGFTALGTIRLTDSTIRGSLHIKRAKLSDEVALDLRGAQILHDLVWKPDTPVAGIVNLEQTKTGRLRDDWSHPQGNWPSNGQLKLDGFAYDSFGGDAPATVDQRLGWLRSQYPTDPQTTRFAAQPYEQLARVYRQAGHDTESRKVSVARQNDLRKYGNLTRRRRVENWLLNVTIRHGYEPARAVAFLLLIYVVVMGCAWHAQHRDAVMVPARTVEPALPADAAENCRLQYPCYYPATYALDVVVPILDIRDADAWRPDARAPWGWAYIVMTVLGSTLGWAFTTLAVLGYTGIVRRE